MTPENPAGCCVRLKRELAWQAMGLDERNPSKFATTAWMRSQHPFLVYRIVCFVYSSSILIWSCYQASQLGTEQLVANWFLSFSTWSFMVFTLYHTIALLLTAINFNNDCLCNDDLAWYHKFCWVLHIVSFNTTVCCFLGTMIHLIAESANDTDVMVYTEVFKGSDINFYIVSPLVMMMDVFVHNITVRLLHFLYPGTFFVFYVLFHVYRWAAGYTETHLLFNFAAIPAAMPTLFVLITVLLVVPPVHALAYAIDYARRKFLLRLWERNRQKKMRAANSELTYIDTRSTLQTEASEVSMREYPDVFDEERLQVEAATGVSMVRFPDTIDHDDIGI